MSPNVTRTLAAPGRTTRRVGLIALALLLLTTAGCFRLVHNETFAIGLEANRANLVVHTNMSKVLYEVAKKGGTQTARNVVVSNTPSKIPISGKQRLAMCIASTALCASADSIGRLLVSWFKSDIRNRGDFYEAVSSAGRSGRCFAWTFAPSRNLTHKGLGTSGCARGGK